MMNSKRGTRNDEGGAGQAPPAAGALLRLLLLAGLAGTLLVLAVDAHDSNVFKGPILVATAILAAATFLAADIRHGSLAWVRSPGAAAVGGLVLLSAAGFFISPVPWHAEQTFLLVAGLGVLFTTAPRLLPTAIDLRRALSALTALAALIILLGFLQYFFAERIGLEFYLGPDRRIGSTLGSPAFLGGFLALLCPLLLGLVPVTRGPARVLTVFVLVGGLVALLLTRSRSSIISLAVALALFAALRAKPAARRRVLIGALLAGAAAALVLLLTPGTADTLLALADARPGSTLSRRLYFWEAGIRAFLAQPWWGHGAGSFEQVVTGFRSPDYWTVGSEDIVPHAHNELIEIAVELGVPGLLLAGLLVWTIACSGLQGMRTGDPWTRSVSAGLLSGLTALAVDNLANVSLRQPPVAAVAALFAGFLCSPAVSGHLAVGHLRIPRWLFPVPLLAAGAFLLWYVPRQARVVEADRHTIEGLLLVRGGDTQGAIRAYEHAASVHRAGFLARSGLAGQLLKAGRGEEAAATARQLQADYPDYPRTWLILAVAELNRGNHERALEAVHREIVLRDHPEAFLVEAAIHKERRDTTGEKRSLEKVLERCLAGGKPLHTAYASTRLLQISRTRQDSVALRPLFTRLSAAFPGDQALLRGRAALGDSAESAER